MCNLVVKHKGNGMGERWGKELQQGWKDQRLTTPYPVLTRETSAGFWVAWMPDTGMEWHGSSEEDVVGKALKSLSACSEKFNFPPIPGQVGKGANKDAYIAVNFGLRLEELEAGQWYATVPELQVGVAAGSEFQAMLRAQECATVLIKRLVEQAAKAEPDASLAPKQ